MAKPVQPRGFTQAEDVRALYEEKLASSGLTPEQGAHLGLSYLTGSESRAAGLWHQGLPALKIPYFHPLTSKALAPAPHWPPFWRARCLRTPIDPPKGFAKYLQPRDTGVCAYFPITVCVDWPTVLPDFSQTLLITEGELKAAKACAEGYPTIALGGVWNFQSRHPESDFLPELELVTWARRIVYICYDSDILRNPQVARAAWRLAEQLRDRGALPYLAIIPDAGDAKSGLDDFLISDGPAALDGVLAASRALTAADCLWEVNERYALVQEGDREVVDMAAGVKIKAEQLKYRTTRRFNERRLSPQGVVTYEPVNAAAAWIDWPLRNEVRRLVFDPSLPPASIVPSETEGVRDFNTWLGLKVPPIKGSVAPFTELLDLLFAGAEPWIREWFIRWLAFPLQHPGTKLFTASVLYGLVHGSGKTLVGETMGRIYGDAYTVIKQDDLKATHNEWEQNKIFILGDDITGIDRLEIHDALKTKITQKKVRVNPKFITAYELTDRSNWLFTSNRVNAFYLDDGDRRFFVWEVPKSAGMKPREFYRNTYLRDWLDQTGPSHLLHYLLNYDLGNFDPGAAAPETYAKLKMREAAQTPVVTWASDLAKDPKAMLVWNKLPVEGDLFTAAQLATYFAAQTGTREDTPHLAKRMSNALVEAGVAKIHSGKIVTCEGRDPARYYAVRNAERWLTASLADIQRHLEPTRYGAGKAPKGSGKKY